VYVSSSDDETYTKVGPVTSSPIHSINVVLSVGKLNSFLSVYLNSGSKFDDYRVNQPFIERSK